MKNELIINICIDYYYTTTLTMIFGINYTNWFENAISFYFKVSVLNCEPFLKLTPKDSCFKCTPTIHESLGAIFKTLVSKTLKIHLVSNKYIKKYFWIPTTF